LFSGCILCRDGEKVNCVDTTLIAQSAPVCAVVFCCVFFRSSSSLQSKFVALHLRPRNSCGLSPPIPTFKARQCVQGDGIGGSRELPGSEWGGAPI
jgi:hypothetical protein